MDLGAYLFLAFLEGLVQAAVLTLTALGLSLVFGVMRVVNIAHGQFFMLGAVVAWWITNSVAASGLGFVVAMVIAPIVVGAIALTSERVVLRPLKYDAVGTIIATIGLLYIIQEITLLTFGPDARPVEPPFYFDVQFPWFGYSGYKLFVIGVATLLLFGLKWSSDHLQIGLVMRATQFDSDTAQAFGVSVDRVYAQVFALGAMLAAVGAVLVVPIQQAQYLMGFDALILSFTAVIVGGLGSIQGTVLAAIVIGLSDGILSVFFAPTLSKIVAALFIALILIFKPEGLLAGSRS
ncbi:MAG: branched-chain amino acid ABC transporter permease [Bradyrhizobium sp.]